MDTVKINEKDNVCVNLISGHKTALCDIKKGEPVIKYGFGIGVAKENINKGEAVHTNNLKTALDGHEEYVYEPNFKALELIEPQTVKAFVRYDGKIGIRNDIWIIPTVGCVNNIAKVLAEKTGAFCFAHPYGCSQLGDDHSVTQKILSGLICHPNAGGVLVLGLGCENNNITELKKVLGEYDKRRVRFLSVQETDDEIETGINLIEELKQNAQKDVRKDVPLSKIVIGLKCGGSDGLSGITANPVVGMVCDKICEMGGTAVLSEVPEMFGAEKILLNHCQNKEVFTKADKMIKSYKNYFIAHNQPVSENPSPGNKAGGITTLEEKSLGCVQKGGNSSVTDVLTYGDTVRINGLNLLNGPGNDIVAITNLTAVGCHLILFTTGRGTPLGAPVPTVKISSNSDIAKKKPHWIDFDAFTLDLNKKSNELFNYVVKVINGEKTNNEKNNYREIAIFKDGVTL